MGSDAPLSLIDPTAQVSIHAPAWGATAGITTTLVTIPVSIHAPAWGATRIDFKTTTSATFQFTLPRGERPAVAAIASPASPFQFTLPRGERQAAGFRGRLRLGFQFTLPRGERHHFRPHQPRYHLVSIHAPAWGATRVIDGAIGKVQVSIHAPAWGATTPRPPPRSRKRFQFTLPRGERRHRHASRLWHRQFQFTLPRGERPSPPPSSPTAPPVSIHAPAWGATAATLGGLGAHGVSIHAPAWGATLAKHHVCSACLFQFTLPRGERHVAQAPLRLVLRFNSRSRVGSDTATDDAGNTVLVSIHAPAWGATPGPRPRER